MQRLIFFCTEEPEVDIFEAPENWMEISDGVSFSDYVAVDENLSSSGKRSEKEIISEILHENSCLENLSSEEEEEQEEKINQIIVLKL